MRYSLEAGGKRLRPALVLECCALCGGSDESALPAAAAVECIHTFSLIHDDLPAMDDDDLRRGRPTNHRVYGEALAILAGDALLALAFEILARHVRPPARAVEMMLALARGAGWEGMIGGQALDIESSRDRGDPRQTGFSKNPLPPGGEGRVRGLEQVRRIHSLKTARLIATACRLGGLAAGAAHAHLSALDGYGYGLGMAFQAVDDLLDVTGTREALGKSAGKDAAAGKLSLAGVVSMEEGWRMAESLAAEAIEALAEFGAAARPLEELARFAVIRRC
jgi:geranylgeranyl diphosphate synthase type II